MTTHNLLVELFVEELPPKALRRLGESFAGTLTEELKRQGLLADTSATTHFASPRRLAAHITDVLAQAPDVEVVDKLMPVSVAFDKAGAPTSALLKKAERNPRCAEQLKLWPQKGTGSDQLFVQSDGKADALYFRSMATGRDVARGLQVALEAAIAKLPIPKVMTYQLSAGTALPGWDSVQFVRPAHGLVALHGEQVVPVTALGLTAGRATHGHRFEAAMDPIELPTADSYAAQLRLHGAVIASFEERRADIAAQLHKAAADAGEGLRAIEDEALLDEVTALVERPNVLVCRFDEQFLGVPQECLILTMKANQKYFPLLDAQGRLTNRFLVVSNISPADASAVIGGNERVVRPRLADAKFFFDQDRKKPLESRVEGLAKVVYHNKLGTQGERVERVRAIARAIAGQIAAANPLAGGQSLVERADLAAKLAKADLLTDMVGEFPELQGIMGGYYARHDGLPEDVAFAIEDHYKPRFAGDELPQGLVGTVVALADKLETLVGMFGIGNLPTGDKDPFALRRHALGVIRMLVEKQLPLDLPRTVTQVVEIMSDHLASSGVMVGGGTSSPGERPQVHSSRIELFRLPVETAENVLGFMRERGSTFLRDQGYSAQEAEAVIAVSAPWSEVLKRLEAVRAFTSLPEAPALAAANKRIGNILKKAEADEAVQAQVDGALLQEPAEQSLYAAMQQTVPQADAQFDAGDYTASLQTLARLREPVDAFFDGVMVNAEDAALRRNRQGLLKTLHLAMNRVADLSRLAQ